MPVLFLAAAALASLPASNGQPRQSAAPVVQARATVRVVSGARVELGQASASDGQQLRTTTISTPEGIRQASLVEFE